MERSKCYYKTLRSKFTHNSQMKCKTKSRKCAEFTECGPQAPVSNAGSLIIHQLEALLPPQPKIPDKGILLPFLFCPTFGFSPNAFSSFNLLLPQDQSSWGLNRCQQNIKRGGYSLLYNILISVIYTGTVILRTIISINVNRISQSSYYFNIIK